MDSLEAKEILLRYRPGLSLEDDPEVRDALEASRNDPELERWFSEHLKFQAALCTGLGKIPVPADLRRSILLAEQDRAKTINWRAAAPWLAMAASVALVGILFFGIRPGESEIGFNRYRNRMISSVARAYPRMDMLSAGLTQIRGYLRTNQVHGDFQLPLKMSGLAGIGCAIERWQDRPVALVCLQTTNREPIYYFIINHSDLPDGPSSPKPELQKVSALMTADWTEGGKTYLLASRDEKFIRSVVAAAP